MRGRGFLAHLFFSMETASGAIMIHSCMDRLGLAVAGMQRQVL